MEANLRIQDESRTEARLLSSFLFLSPKEVTRTYKHSINPQTTLLVLNTVSPPFVCYAAIGIEVLFH